MRTTHFIVAMLLLAVTFIACQHKNNVTPALPNNNGNADTALCFERDILPIFQSNCAKSGCHDAITQSDGYNFTSYQNIIAKKFKAGDPDDCELFEKITDNNPQDIMPPPPNTPLSNIQVALIKRWILMGAPNSGNCGSAGCDTMNYKLAAHVQPILIQNCIGCHNSISASGGIQLDNYNGILAVAQDGRLKKAINHLAGVQPMPQGGNKLNACNIRVIEKWMESGMLNN